MKFDYIVGNPPYQKDASENNRSMPIYHLFIDSCASIATVLNYYASPLSERAEATPQEWNLQDAEQ